MIDCYAGNSLQKLKSGQSGIGLGGIGVGIGGRVEKFPRFFHFFYGDRERTVVQSATSFILTS